MWKAPWAMEARNPLTRRSNMNSLSPAENTSRATEDDILEPLTVKKSGSFRIPSISSPAFYPRIPRRKSSLSASVSADSTGHATSTRTPSLSESHYQIEVAKIRRPQIPDHQKMIGGDLMADPFVDEIPKPQTVNQKNRTNHKYGPAPQLVLRWSSGSWVFPESPSSSSSLSLGPAHPKTDLEHSSVTPADQGNFNSLCPIDLPVAFVNVRSTASRSHIGTDPVSLWTTVHVSADVNPMSFPGASALAPLDVVVVLDSLPQPSVNILTQITLGSSVLASHLIYQQDRLALAYVDGRAKRGFQVLLPLGFHDADAVRSALNTFSRRQPMKSPMPRAEPVDIIEQLSGMFGLSPRNAFCHLFFVSAIPPAHLSLPRINPAIGFHTISPQSCFPMNMRDTPFHSGWHISYDVGDGDVGPKETHFVRKVSRVIRQLRSGIRPGSIVNLKLSIEPADGIQVDPTVQDCRLVSLRPGETWSIPVQVHVPAASQQTSQGRDHKVSTYHPIVEELMAQINHVLQEFTSNEVPQPIMTARVDCQHSLLPDFNTLHVDDHLTVIRRASANLNSLSDIEGMCSGVSFGLGTLSESL